MTRIAVLFVLVLTAPAQARTIDRIETPLQAVPDGAVVGAGEGHVAWATGRGTLHLWTRGYGGATPVAALRCGCSAYAVEVGMDRAGRAVALVGTIRPDRDRGALRLVRLDTGATAKVRHGEAIDSGRLFFVRRQALWAAPLRGTKVGRATRLRAVPHGERWQVQAADEGRLGMMIRTAVDAECIRQRPAFGRPRGRWRSAPASVACTGPGGAAAIVGVSRAGLVTHHFREDGVPPILRLTTPAGTSRRVQDGLGAASLARGGRLFAVGEDSDGDQAVGFTAVAFP